MLVAGNRLKEWTRMNLQRGRTAVEGPSAPGEYPHIHKGRLVDSINASRLKEDMHGMSIEVGTNLDYGVYHELTERPFLRRTLHEMRGPLKRILTGGGAGGFRVV
jgi:hypothetical protein